MKHRLILKQHLPFAAMIHSALDFCETMLSQSSTLYPFAVLSIDHDVQCIFTPHHDHQDTTGLIENLQERVSERKLFVESAHSLIGYCATIEQESDSQSDAVVFCISHSDGNNNLTIYPYQRMKTGISFGQPYVCNFSD